MLVASTIAVAGAVVGALWSGYQLAALSDGGTEIDRYSLRLIGLMTLICIFFAVFTFIASAKVKRKLSRQDTGVAATVRLPSSADKISKDSDVPSSREIA